MALIIWGGGGIGEIRRLVMKGGGEGIYHSDLD